jgi:hypothetical protein
MLTVPVRTLGKRALILESPASQAPPPPVRVNPAGQVTDAQVLAAPPGSVQFVEPELGTSVQFSVSAIDGELLTRGPIRASAPAPQTCRIDRVKSSIISLLPVSGCEPDGRLSFANI